VEHVASVHDRRKGPSFRRNRYSAVQAVSPLWMSCSSRRTMRFAVVRMEVVFPPCARRLDLFRIVAEDVVKFSLVHMPSVWRSQSQMTSVVARPRVGTVPRSGAGLLRMPTLGDIERDADSSR